jgi:hypothetical protein
LQPHVQEPPLSIRPRTLLVATMLAGIAVFGLAAPQSATFSSNHPGATSVVEQPSREAPLDFNGNEIRQAIARYKVDPTGVLYEEHSPDTEVPRLAPPKG